VRGQAASSALWSIVLVSLLLVHSLRSFRFFLATLLLLLVGLVWTAGFAAVAIGHLNLISSSFAVIFIGLGVDFGIHLCLRYNELLAQMRSHLHALRGAAYDVGSSIVLGGVTTAIGFLAFMGTGFVGVAELGVISAGGLLVSILLTFTFLPALMSLRPRPADGLDPSEAGWSGARLSALPVRHPRAVRVAALVLGVASILLLPQARFDNNPLNVRDPSSESVRTFNDLLEKGGTSPWTLDAVAPDLATAEATAEELRDLDVVERVVTVADYIPSDQDEKLDIIGDVRLFMAPRPGPDGAPAPASAREQIAALRELDDEIGRLLADGAPAALATPAARLREGLGAYFAKLASGELPAGSVADLEKSLMGTLPEQLRILDAALSAGRVTLQNLPDALRERMITADGRVRVQIFPREDIGDRKHLAAFVDGVREVVPEVAGSAAEVLESGRAVVRALQQALFGAVVAIAIVLWLAWRRIDDTALVLIPLSLAAGLTVATAVILDIPFNFADVIVLPLLLGMGVDSCVHLIHRARFPIAHDHGVLGTSTARAVFYSALTSIFGFGTMGFASHMGLATLGQMLTLGVTYSMLCNMVVLPALIALRSERQRRLEEGGQARLGNAG
jgi:hopanoid biosynthesis associated RND transporter like protein HpnN